MNRVATRQKYGLFRMPQPANDAEFAILSEWYFGMPLSVRDLRVGYYKIEQSYNSYHGKGFAYHSCSLGGYDHSRALMNFVFGILGTGGTAEVAYGSTMPHGHRHAKRLQRWVRDRTAIGRGAKGSPPSKPFKRLAGRILRARREQTEAGRCLS